MAHLVGDSTLSLLTRGSAWLPGLRRRLAGGPARTRLPGRPARPDADRGRWRPQKGHRFERT